MIKHYTSVYEVFMAMNFKCILLAESCSLITQSSQSLVHFRWTRIALEVCGLLHLGLGKHTNAESFTENVLSK